MSDASTHGSGVSDDQEPAEGSRETVEQELADEEGGEENTEQ